MIQIPREALSPKAARGLRIYQATIDREPNFSRRVELAAASFRRYNRARNPTFREVRGTLTKMCVGAKRCMYCEDAPADEVEHHRPKNLYPGVAFVWDNYVYACGPCNGPKNNQYAVFHAGRPFKVTRKRGKPPAPPVAGEPVLLHPRIENALDFMMLDIPGDTFLFVPAAAPGSREFERAAYTIKVLGLNERDYLLAARREAYASYKARVAEYARKRDAAAGAATLDHLVLALRRMHHPTVWREMLRQQAKIPELASLFAEVPEALAW